MVRDADYTVSRIRAIACEDFSQSALIAGEGDSAAIDQVVDADEFSRKLQDSVSCDSHPEPVPTPRQEQASTSDALPDYLPQELRPHSRLLHTIHK
ncbi:hypothetical protein [Duncaniella freteri]|uniref:hypothetical protein n=1 Tax=Duncaniella freteri TaxID=2530391 RepID=UPI003F67E167